MADLDVKMNDIEYYKWLIKLKNEKPEEYKKFWADLKDVMKDMIKIAKEINDELED